MKKGVKAYQLAPMSSLNSRKFFLFCLHIYGLRLYQLKNYGASLDNNEQAVSSLLLKDPEYIQALTRYLVRLQANRKKSGVKSDENSITSPRSRPFLGVTRTTQQHKFQSTYLFLAHEKKKRAITKPFRATFYRKNNANRQAHKCRKSLEIRRYERGKEGFTLHFPCTKGAQIRGGMKPKNPTTDARVSTRTR
jgi:hypothetical protein